VGKTLKLIFRFFSCVGYCSVKVELKFPVQNIFKVFFRRNRKKSISAQKACVDLRSRSFIKPKIRSNNRKTGLISHIYDISSKEEKDRK